MSQQGTDNSGNLSDTFSNYREDASGNETGTFHPNVLIDFINGRLKAKNAEIEGVIHATGGKFSGFLQTPYVNLGTLTSNVNLDFSTGFNFTAAGIYTYGTRTVYLPTGLTYDGMHCTVFVRSYTKSSVAVRVRITGGGDFYYPGYGLTDKIYGIDVFNRKLKLEAMPNSSGTGVTWYIENYFDFDETDFLTS
jgi:hypothetical protein